MGSWKHLWLVNTLVPMTRRCQVFLCSFIIFLQHTYATETLVPFWWMQSICLKYCVALKQHWQVALKQHIKPCCSLPIDSEINILLYLVCTLLPVNWWSIDHQLLKIGKKKFVACRQNRAVDIIEHFRGRTMSLGYKIFCVGYVLWSFKHIETILPLFKYIWTYNVV